AEAMRRRADAEALTRGLAALAAAGLGVPERPGRLRLLAARLQARWLPAAPAANRPGADRPGADRPGASARDDAPGLADLMLAVRSATMIAGRPDLWVLTAQRAQQVARRSTDPLLAAVGALAAARIASAGGAFAAAVRHAGAVPPLPATTTA